MLNLVVMLVATAVGSGYGFKCEPQLQPTTTMTGRNVPLSIGVLLPRSYRPLVEAAVDLALVHVYEERSLLPGYCLHLIYKDTQCRTSLGMKALFDLMDTRYNHSIPREGEDDVWPGGSSKGGGEGGMAHRPVALFGDICTDVNEPVASTAKYWNILQLSFSETHSKFASADSRELYPTFFRMVPGDRSVIAARCLLIKRFNWTRIGSIKQSDDPVYSLPHERLVARLENEHGIRVVYSASLSSDQTASIGYELDELKKRDAHIIVGDFSASLAIHVLCEAHSKGMYGESYSWILPGYHTANWWRDAMNGETEDSNSASVVNCTKAQIYVVLQSHFAVEFAPLRPFSKERLVGGRTVGKIQRQLSELCMEREGDACPENIHHSYAYDGIWTIALSLNETIYRDRRRSLLPLEGVDAQNQRLITAMQNTDFQGLSGRVRFENNERLGIVHLLQWTNGSYSKVGYHDTTDGTFKLVPADDWVPPLDATVLIHQRQRVSLWLLVLMSLLATFGISLALFFFFINIRFRNHRFIRMSSPNMNNLIIAGSICAYSAVLLLGVDTRMVTPETFERLCYAKTWVLSVGFTLSFGAMFSKTWRVHSIFTNVRRDKKAIKDYQLYIIVAAIMLVDAVILSLWAVIAPFRFSVSEQEKTHSHNLLIVPELERCESRHSVTFQVVYYIFKGMLMVFGCFLAWETRAVNVPALNDSKYIGMSVYIVVVMCVVGLSLAFILQERLNEAFALISFFVRKLNAMSLTPANVSMRPSIKIIFCTTLTLVLVFAPKVLEVIRTPVGGDQQRYRKGMMKSMTGSKASSCSEMKVSRQLST